MAKTAVFTPLTKQMIAELSDALPASGGDPQVIVLAGEGKHFSAGADGSGCNAPHRPTGMEPADARTFAGMLATTEARPNPTVAPGVQGAALGGGVGPGLRLRHCGRRQRQLRSARPSSASCLPSSARR